MATTTGARFVGREEQLSRLDRAAAEAAAGRPQVVLVHGVPGIGKTALLRAFLDRHRDFCVLSASGDENEIHLAYGIVDQLAHASPPIGRPPLAELTGSAAAPDPMAVGARLLQLLSSLESDIPLALVVDDVHWADRLSLDALAFALRRLRADRILTLLAARTAALAELPQSVLRAIDAYSGDPLELRGLDEAALRALAPGLSAPAARRLYEHTDGNPLHVHAVLAELDLPILNGSADVPLPAPRSFAALVLKRLGSCPDAAERLVVAAAVLGTRCPLRSAVSLADLDAVLEPLQQAVDADLLVAPPPGRQDLAFTHPLVRAAVYHDLAPRRRSQLHARAAVLAETEASALRHRVAAAPMADGPLATELAEFAARQARRGTWSSAAAAFFAASRLAPTHGDRERFALEAVQCVLLGGDVPGAAGAADQVAACAPGARRSYIQGLLSFLSGQRVQAEQLLTTAWRQCRLPDDGELAGCIAGYVAMIAANDGRGADTVTWGRRALDLTPTTMTATVSPLTTLMFGLAESGQVGEGLRLVDWLPEHVVGPDARSADALTGRGVLRMWSDNLAGARADLATSVDASRRLGASYLRIMALFYLAETEYRLGAWDEAISHAELAASLAHDGEMASFYGLVHAVAAFPAAGQGDWERAETHARAATEAAALLGDQASRLWAGMATARIAHARADHATVARVLSPLVELAGVDGLHEPGIQPWQQLYIEALIALGRLPEANLVLDAFAEKAAARGHPTALINVVRLRGLLLAAQGERDQAEQVFTAASVGDATPPFDRALLEAACGGLLRRAGKRRAALAHLQVAHDLFDQLGAAPFLARCERELAGCGLTPAKRSDPDRTRLTPQELAVATLVAQGMRNKEVAVELVVSAKTVEHHLGNVYAKLGVSTRGRLAARLTALPASRPHQPPAKTRPKD